MQDKIKFILFLTVAVTGFTSVAKADTQSDYARVMSAMSAAPDDGSDSDNAAAPSSANSPSTSTTQQPISIYGKQAFRGTSGTSSQFSGGNQISGGTQISAGNPVSGGTQTFNFHPGIPPLNQ
jgi:hypothetical protein